MTIMDLLSKIDWYVVIISFTDLIYLDLPYFFNKLLSFLCLFFIYLALSILLILYNGKYIPKIRKCVI